MMPAHYWADMPSVVIEMKGCRNCGSHDCEIVKTYSTRETKKQHCICSKCGQPYKRLFVKEEHVESWGDRLA